MIKLIELITKPHGYTRFEWLDYCIELSLKLLILVYTKNWKSFREKYVKTYRNLPATKPYQNDVNRFLIGMCIVLKSYNKHSKGVVVVHYNYGLPTFDMLFDLERIEMRYNIVLEPSTSRLCMPEVLMYKGLDANVYIETNEPRDARFLKRFMDNAVPVNIVSNWWVDSRIYTHCPKTVKEYDLIMVASWNTVKRHKLLFSVLNELNERGHRLTCVLVGYPANLTKNDIELLASEYGVLNQITIHEWLSPKEVASQYQKSCLNLILSKREGSNRSIIEGLYCGVPFLLSKGFNFGDTYNYLNSKTGSYYEDEKLGDQILDSLANLSKFDPVDWLSKSNVSAQGAADELSLSIFGKKGLLTTKSSGLHGMEHWDKSDEKKYQADYDYLRLCQR